MRALYPPAMHAVSMVVLHASQLQGYPCSAEEAKNTAYLLTKAHIPPKPSNLSLTRLPFFLYPLLTAVALLYNIQHSTAASRGPNIPRYQDLISADQDT